MYPVGQFHQHTLDFFRFPAILIAKGHAPVLSDQFYKLAYGTPSGDCMSPGWGIAA